MVHRGPALLPAPAAGFSFHASSWNLFQLGLLKWLFSLPRRPALAIALAFLGACSRPFCASVILECHSVYKSAPDLKARGCVPSHFIPCTQGKGCWRTRCSSWLPTVLGDRREALWGSCCQWWLQREMAAQFSRPHSPWHSTNWTCFFIYCRHGNWVV